MIIEYNNQFVFQNRFAKAMAKKAGIDISDGINVHEALALAKIAKNYGESVARELVANGVSALKLEQNHISPEAAMAVVTDARLAGVTLEDSAESATAKVQAAHQRDEQVVERARAAGTLPKRPPLLRDEGVVVKLGGIAEEVPSPPPSPPASPPPQTRSGKCNLGCATFKRRSSRKSSNEEKESVNDESGFIEQRRLTLGAAKKP
jgi:hypothetical protein